MINEKQLLESFEMTPAEFKQKQKQWLSDIQSEVRSIRKRIYSYLNKLRQSNICLAQTEMRIFSTMYSSLLAKDQTSIPFKLPLKIASSPQDCFHHTHFIQTVLLFCSEKQTPLLDNNSSSSSNQTVTNLCQVELDQPTRLENQKLVYYKLFKLIQKIAQDDLKKIKAPVTLQTLERRLYALENGFKKHCTTQHPNEDLDTGAAHRS